MLPIISGVLKLPPSPTLGVESSDSGRPLIDPRLSRIIQKQAAARDRGANNHGDCRALLPRYPRVCVERARSRATGGRPFDACERQGTCMYA